LLSAFADVNDTVVASSLLAAALVASEKRFAPLHAAQWLHQLGFDATADVVHMPAEIILALEILKTPRKNEGSDDKIGIAYERTRHRLQMQGTRPRPAMRAERSNAWLYLSSASTSRGNNCRGSTWPTKGGMMRLGCVFCNGFQLFSSRESRFSVMLFSDGDFACVSASALAIALSRSA